MSPRRRRPTVPVALVLLAVLATGCRLGLTAEVEVERDGTGRAALTIALDQALLDELDELGVDPTAELSVAAEQAPTWTVERSSTDEGLELRLSHEADDPRGLTDAFRELTSGLAPEDPALVVDLDLEVADDGRADLAGTVELRAPVAPGAVGLPDAPTADELAALTGEHVTASLVVTLPGEPLEHDADTVDDRTLSWQVPVGPARSVQASAAAPDGPPLEVVLAGAAGALVLLAGVAVARTLRRRRRA